MLLYTCMMIIFTAQLHITRLVDKPWKVLLRNRILLSAALLVAYVGLASLLGLAPISHSNDHFGWQMLNGVVLLGAIGFAVAGVPPESRLFCLAWGIVHALIIFTVQSILL